MLDTLVREDVEVLTTDEPGDASHIVMVPQGVSMSPQAYVLQARIEGTKVRALCGYEWVPQKDPKSLPVCSLCKEIYEYDPNGFGDRGELPDP